MHADVGFIVYASCVVTTWVSDSPSCGLLPVDRGMRLLARVLRVVLPPDSLLVASLVLFVCLLLAVTISYPLFAFLLAVRSWLLLDDCLCCC